MLSVWVTGLALGTVRFARGWNEVSRLTDGLCPWTAPAHAERPDRLERILGRPIPPIFTSSHVVSPVAIGLFRPLVILPEGLTETLAPAQLRQVLLHECAHVAFRHILGGVVARVARLLFWPHPPVHALCRELARAREEICDNVASQEDGAACYARTLLAMAQGMFAAPKVTSALALLGPETSLEERIAGLLDPRRNRMVRMKRGTLWAATSAAVLALGSTAVIRVVASEGKAKQDATGTAGLQNVRQMAAQMRMQGQTPDEREAKLKAEAWAKNAGTPVGRNLKPPAIGASGADAHVAKQKAEAAAQAAEAEAREREAKLKLAASRKQAKTR